jgi:uncharacterized membrane protein YoaK (UPF0700 family)
MSSSALLERVIDRQKTLELVSTAPQSATERQSGDTHPLLPIFIAGAISFVVATIFIGSILMWLAMRHTGVMAP